MAKTKTTEEKEATVENVLKTAKVKANKKEGFTMELVYDEVITLPTNEVIITPVSKFPPKTPHEDMFKALRLLVPHWAIDAEEKDVKDFNKKYFENDMALEDKSLERFKVTGIHVKDKNEQKHVVLVGRKVLKSGRVINHSPMFNIDNMEDGYIYAEQLNKAVENFMKEVGEYMEGKVAPNPQTTMFPETGEPGKSNMKVAS